MKRFVIHMVLILLCFNSCMKDDALWVTDGPERHPNSGVFIINEGNFTYGNASLSFYNINKEKIQNDVFFNTNALPLGDVAHSMHIRDSLGYVVINNSGKIYILNINTFAYTGKITGFTSPRYVHFINETKAYVTDLYARSISTVNPNTMEITGSINVSNGDTDYYQHPTEQMLQFDKYVFTNCWSYDNKILVIDTETDQVVDSIEVLKQPKAMVMDRFNRIWVITDGGYPGSPYGYETPGLIRINAATRNIEHTIRFSEGDSPTDLQINGTRDTIYFINRHVYRLSVYSEDAPELFLKYPESGTLSAGYYSLGIDPWSSEIYAADAIDQVQPGRVYRYRSDATPLDTFRVGINPGNFCFKATSI